MSRGVERDIDDEIAYHLERRVAEYVAAGLDPIAARERAMQRFGQVSSVRDEAVRMERAYKRRQSARDLVAAVARDARVALRAILKSPGFAITSIVCIALGVGVTTMILSAVDAMLVRPLPYPNARQLVSVYAQNVSHDYHRVNVSYKDYVSWRDENRSLLALGIWTWATITITTGESERVSGAAVSANLFSLLGVRPMLGRGFRPEEERLASSDVVLLGYGLWQRRFGGDSSIVGRTISMDGRPHLVAGVMPPGFSFPDVGQFWMPFATDGPSSEPRNNREYAGAIGRLRPGVTVEQATTDLARVSAQLQREFPNENTGWAAEVMTLREDLTGDFRRPLFVFLGAVAFVLLIACANVANLTLVRGISRGRELALRSALGAARGDLVRQLFTESALIAVAGGVAGAVAGIWAVRLARLAFPNGVPFYFDFTVDARALAASALVIVMTAVLCGVVPALRVTKLDVNRALRDERARTGGSGDAHVSGRSILVVAELAISTVLVIGGALLVRSYRAYTHTDLGFDRAGILTARVTLPDQGYEASARRIALFTNLEARVRAIPGVRVVGSAQGIPFSGWDVQSDVWFDGRPPARPNEEFESHFQVVSPDFFPALGVALVRGRALAAADRDTLAPVAVVNESFVRRAYPNEDPIGKRVRFAPPESGQPWVTIVGVVRDYRHYRLPQPMGPALYMPYRMLPTRSQVLVVRTRLTNPYAIVPAMRAALHDLDPGLALYDVKTMDDAVNQSLWRQRVQSRVLAAFAALALLLAAVGLYGLVSYSVFQRTREIGVRVALGAQRGDVLALVYGHGGRLVLAGLAIGLTSGALLSRTLGSLLYEVAPIDVLSYALAACVIAAISFAALFIPARRAMSVDPSRAMRAE
ncbi:MAG TPA: ABC transporter permease [Gemmatimonadaceae bacterium]|nr:ABC transporter permease [Gemmatimonadaceae bacterium]